MSTNSEYKRLSTIPCLESLKLKSKIIFFFIGTLNNICVEITLVYSNDLAKQFNKTSIMTIFHAFMIIFAISTRIINAKYLLNIRHRIKNLIVVACFCIGVVSMLIAYWKNIFILTLVTMLFFGIGTSLGEANNLGFLKGFPAETSAGYTTGTGLSGLLGTVFYFLLKLFHFSFYAVNLSILVFYPFYIFSFHYACILKKKISKYSNQNLSFKQGESLQSSDSLTQSVIEENEAAVNKSISWKNVKLLWPTCKFLFILFFCLYLLEYVCNSWLTSHIVSSFSNQYKKGESPFCITYAFELASITYRLFLFLGRGSLLCVKCPKIKLMSMLLFGISLFYLIQALSKTFFSLPVMFVTLSVIAFIGGVIFSNIIFAILDIPGIKKKHREIAVNILGIFGESGMFASSILGLIFLRLLP